jgi:hypothetical protein
MARRQIYFILATLTILVSSCKKETTEFTDWPIVESYLTPGNYFTLKISRQIPFSSDVEYSSDNINALSIEVTHNDTVHTLTPLDSGKYIDSTLIVREGEQYKISFIFNKKNVSAFTKIPSHPTSFAESVTSISVPQRVQGQGFSGTMPSPVQLTWTNTDKSYYLVVIENIETNPVSIYDFGDKEPPDHKFRKPPIASSGLEINPREFRYFGTHRIILFHVLPDYAALYNQGSSSSQNLTNPSTSISNGYGIFTGLNSDTLFIEVNEQ